MSSQFSLSSAVFNKNIVRLQSMKIFASEDYLFNPYTSNGNHKNDFSLVTDGWIEGLPEFLIPNNYSNDLRIDMNLASTNHTNDDIIIPTSLDDVRPFVD